MMNSSAAHSALVPAPFPAPSADTRWRLVEAAMRQGRYQRQALIESLQAVQQAFGYVDKVALDYVARSLRVPLSAAYGVVTFYHFFTLKLPGRHTCLVCTGTACYIHGSQAIVDQLQTQLGIHCGQTTSDGAVSLLEARCIGSCGLAPLVVLDGDVVPHVTVTQLASRLEEWQHG
ncbi:MAG: NAD(P)H-dependent oxidoreductase subunit E [Planctomycetota bacterium]